MKLAVMNAHATAEAIDQVCNVKAASQVANVIHLRHCICEGFIANPS